MRIQILILGFKGLKYQCSILSTEINDQKKMKVAIFGLISVTITTKKGHSKQNYNYISQTCL